VTRLGKDARIRLRDTDFGGRHNVIELSAEAEGPAERTQLSPAIACRVQQSLGRARRNASLPNRLRGRRRCRFGALQFHDDLMSLN
jgi:hypothetical protein